MDHRLVLRRPGWPHERLPSPRLPPCLSPLWILAPRSRRPRRRRRRQGLSPHPGLLRNPPRRLRSPPKLLPHKLNSRGRRRGEQPQLIFSPWTKFCLKGQEANAKQVCFTGKDGRVESGMPVVAAVLIEPEGEPKKILRVTLAARHVAPARHPGHRRQGPADDRALCDLLQQRLHGRLRGERRTDRQAQEGAGAGRCRASTAPASRSVWWCR